MKNRLLKTLIVTGAVFGVIGCGSGSSLDGIVEDAVSSVVDDATSQLPIDGIISELPAEVQDAIDGPESVLTEDLKDAITYMYNEEGLAYDVYMNIYEKQPVNQLQKIAQNSETKHMAAVDELAVKYDLNMTAYDPTLEPYSKEGISNGTYSVPHIQELYDLLYAKGIKSEKDALEVGCMVEVVDVDDLDKYLELATEANATDVLDVFNFLIEGSYKHYWTFDSALMKANNSTDPNDGCCSVEDEFGLGYSFCHTEYPDN